MHASREDQGRVAVVPFDPARPDAVVEIGTRASCNKKEKEKKSTTRPPYSPYQYLGLESSYTPLAGFAHRDSLQQSYRGSLIACIYLSFPPGGCSALDVTWAS